MDYVIENLNKLSIVDDPLHILNDIKLHLTALPSRDIKASFVSNYPVSYVKPLFDMLNSCNRDQVKLCAEILNLILMNMDQIIAFNSMHEQYIKCLDHPNEIIRLLILKQLLISSEDDKCATLILREAPLLHMVLKLVGDKSMDVIKYAHKVILSLSSHSKVDDSIEIIFNCEGVAILKNIMRNSDSSRFHVYDIAVKLCMLNEKHLLHIASVGFLGELVNELSSGDILTHLNALELLSELASAAMGLRFLQTTGIITKLSYILSTSRKDNMAAILLPGILKFFGNLGYIHPQLLAEDQLSVLSDIMKTASNSDSSMEISVQLIAFETLAHIGTSVEGKDALLKYSVEMENAIKDLSTQFKSFPTEMQVRFLDAMAELFYLKKEEQSDDICSRMEMWFQHLSDDSSMKIIFDLSKQPFLELSCSSLRIMKSLTTFHWGIKMMAQEPGLIEWLLERGSSRDKTTKELQWEVVEALCHDQFAKDFFTEDVGAKFLKYYEQGPFFVDAEHSVAFEMES